MRESLSVGEAQQAILREVAALPSERVAARDAFFRVLAEAVHSTRQLPPADCSAMDGYAVRGADLVGASATSAVTLPVVYEVAAGGHAPRPLEAGEAARIFTGAPVPAGADAVVRQEDTEAQGQEVSVAVAPKPREHIRDAGEDLQVGDCVLDVGHELGAAELGVLSSLGRSVVTVHQRPRVAILSGGDELVEPDGDISGGRIVSSNSYSLAAQCLALGAEPVYLGIARDRPEELERHLLAGTRADCIVTSAGVSVGDHDYVRPVLEKLGCELLFWGVKMKPGFPLAFGRFGDGGPLVFGLPGNPVSASVTFEQFVRPALRKLSGHASLFLPTLPARIDHDLAKRAGRLHFVRVQLRREGDEWVASTTGNQSSGVMTSLTKAQGLMIFPEATKLCRGDRVVVQLLDTKALGGEISGSDLSSEFLAHGRMSNVSGAVLVGGASSRMGRDKASIDVQGETLGLRTAGLLSELCAEVLWVGGDPPKATPALPRLRYVPDPDTDAPKCALRGLVAALAAATSERVLVVATDMPLLSLELLAGLVAWPEHDAVVPRDAQGQRHPLCALYRREVVLEPAQRELAAGRYALHHVLSAVDLSWLEGADLEALDPSGQALSNVNTPEELAEVERRLQS